MAECFAVKAVQGYDPQPEEPIFESMMRQYGAVVAQSLLQSFGLDGLLVHDRYGGDVDTVHNVRNIGVDPQMQYKNAANERAYALRGEYDSIAYHTQDAYRQTKSSARAQFNATGQLEDAYTGGNLMFTKSKAVAPSQKADLDHVVSAKNIHDDRGRVMAGLDGKELANQESNLKFTNASLNRSMGKKDIPDYIAAHPELPEDQKQRMMDAYNTAKADMDAQINRAYYTSPRFAQDLGVAAATVGVGMGVRQALGFVFAEMLFAVQDELTAWKEKNQADDTDFAELFRHIGQGIQQGYQRAKEKYADLFQHFLKGTVAGALASLTTTLCNIFFTTASNTVKIIRESWASLVEAGETLFINPKNYEFGDRIRAAAKILAVGASVVMGTIVREAVAKTPLGQLAEVGPVVQNFCASMVSGIMSCTLLLYLDRSKVINKLVQVLNNVHTIETEIDYLRRCAEAFEAYAAELMRMTPEHLRQQMAKVESVVASIHKGMSETALNDALMNAYRELDIKIPWGEGDFDTFMADKGNRLVFE